MCEHFRAEEIVVKSVTFIVREQLSREFIEVIFIIEILLFREIFSKSRNLSKLQYYYNIIKIQIAEDFD